MRWTRPTATAYGNGGTWFAPLADSTVLIVDGAGAYAPGSSNYFVVEFTLARDGGIVAAGNEYVRPATGAGPDQHRSVFLKMTESGHADTAFGVSGIARGAFSASLPVGFLRDIEDRWLLVSATTLSDDLSATTLPVLNAGGLIERYKGERPDSVSVIEFYNYDLRHYFLTASAAEAAGIDAGAAGPGWVRTGENFRAWQPASAASLVGVPQLAQTLCRFYGTPGRGPNSHFYTISMPECDFVRRDPGWTFENYAFYAYATLPVPAGNICPGGLLPVYRVYNNRFAQNDSNHRYMTNSSTYQQMLQLGWKDEGVVFCVAAR